MVEFLAELRRRHLFRIGGIYVVVAWGITQVIDVLSQIYALPDWIAQPIVAVLAIGFPVVLIAAWMIVGAAKAGETPAELKKANATDWTLAGALVAVLAFMGYQQFSSNNVAVADATATAVADEIVQDVAERLPNSVAVLPFDNVSPNPEDAYFSVGVHDEVLNQLYKLRNLRVIARNSVLEYQDSTKPIPEIANELNVEMVMQGSVRLAGDQVRVSVQLYDGSENVPVWTDEYDGDLSDIFGIQADIAMNVANSLQATFSAAEQESIERPLTNNPEAHAMYLRALAIERDGIAGASEASIARRATFLRYIDEALRLDPDFAAAYVRRAEGSFFADMFQPVTENERAAFKAEIERRILADASRALALDPSLGVAHAMLAWMHLNRWRGEEARLEADRAIQLSPRDPDVLYAIGWVEYFVSDRYDEAIRAAEDSLELDPRSEVAFQSLGQFLQLSGRYDDAIAVLHRCLEVDPLSTGCQMRLAAAEFARGSDREAVLDSLNAIRLNQTLSTLAFRAYGFGLLGERGEAQEAFEQLSSLAATQYVDPVIWAWAYMGIGDYDEGLVQLGLAANNRESIDFPWVAFFTRFNVWSDPMLEESEFVDLRERLAFE